MTADDVGEHRAVGRLYEMADFDPSDGHLHSCRRLASCICAARVYAVACRQREAIECLRGAERLTHEVMARRFAYADNDKTLASVIEAALQMADFGGRDSGIPTRTDADDSGGHAPASCVSDEEKT